MVDTREMVGPNWHHYEGEVETLETLCEELPQRATIVNIGTGYGTSSLVFYQTLPFAVIFTIDVAKCDRAFETWANEGVGPGRIIPITGPSAAVGRWWPWQVDMVFVDGAHHQPGVMADIMAWQKRVKPGGLLVFHDYDNPVCPAVKNVVDEMMAGQKPLLHEGYIIAFRVEA